MLTRIRDVLVTESKTGFPVYSVEGAMAAVGKGLSFDTAEIDELLNLKYAGQRTFAVLSVLYPGLGLGKKFHEDRIFPKSRCTRKKLLQGGIPGDEFDGFLDSFNLLPNLQLLAGTANIEKQDFLPGKWTASAFPSEEKRRTYLEENDLDGLSLELGDFMTFFEHRKTRITTRLIRTLGALPDSVATE